MRTLLGIPRVMDQFLGTAVCCHVFPSATVRSFAAAISKLMGNESALADGVWVEFHYLAETKLVDMRLCFGTKVWYKRKNNHPIYESVFQASHLHSLTKTVV